MSRLRYPFTEVSARCRLCGAEGLTASSEHALGGRLIDWRRSHAPVCPEWPRWAEKKGLRLDERGALLYPSETGPYEPRIRPKADDAQSEAQEPIEADVSEAPEPPISEPLETSRPRALWLVPDAETPEPAANSESMVSSAEEDVAAAEPIPLPVADTTPRRNRRAAGDGGRRSAETGSRSNRATAPDVDLMEIPIERLRQAELF